jgi:Protein of unknown function (DUF4242)
VHKHAFAALIRLKWAVPPAWAAQVAPWWYNNDGRTFREACLTLRRFIIERAIPKVGSFERQQLREAAMKSNEVLNQLAPDIQWVESFVADDKTFCVYLAKDEEVIRKHAEVSGFPATKITAIRRLIDPTTARPY